MLSSATEKYVKPDTDRYSVKFVDQKKMSKEIKADVERLSSALVHHHMKLMKKDFKLLGLDDTMPDDFDWEWYNKHAHIYCLYDGDNIIGLCTCQTHASGRRAKNSCYIMELIIQEGYRGKGLGTFLVTAAYEDCKKHEPYIKTVMLDVYDANTQSLHSYLGQGFKYFSHALFKQI